MTGRLFDIADVIEALVARMRNLAMELAPDGSLRGDEWVARNPTRHDTRPGSFSINVRTGVWADFAASDVRGDALDLVAYVKGLPKGEALRWAIKWLGMPGTFDTRAQQGRRPPHRPPTDEREAAKRVNPNGSTAFRLWLNGAASIDGTPAGQYLAGRGLDPARFAALGRVPAALRFHARLYAPDDRDLPLPERRPYPALVAAIHVPGIKGVAAVHRTFLAPDHATGGWGKARALANPKLTLGVWKGGSIRLWRGEGGKPIEDAPAGSWVTASEGIEDGLSIALACPEKRVIAAVSVNNFANLLLPKQIAGIEIAAQNDPPKPDGSPAPATIAVDRAVDALRARGFAVRVIRPPVGVKDWNDLLRQGEASRGAA